MISYLKTFLFSESYSTFWFNLFNLCSASLSILIFGVLYILWSGWSAFAVSPSRLSLSLSLFSAAPPCKLCKVVKNDATPPDLSSVSCDHETMNFGRLHSRSCDTMGIYRNTSLPSLVKRHQTVIDKSRQNEFSWPLLTFTFDLLTPKVYHFMSLLHGPLVPILSKLVR